MKEIYYHVGLGKTASTYLAEKVFPHFQNTVFSRHPREKHYETMEKASDGKFFVSHEFDRQLIPMVEMFSKRFPNAKPIIVLRIHDAWLASQYKRFVKNGFSISFKQFIDLENDTGYWKMKDALFFPMLQKLESAFQTKPLVLFHDDLKTDAYGFIDSIATFCDVTYDRNKISTKPFHSAYSTRQLKMMRRYGWNRLESENQFSDNKIIQWFQKRTQLLRSYSLMAIANFLPEKWIDPKPLITTEELEKVGKKFEHDWKQCLEFAGR